MARFYINRSDLEFLSTQVDIGVDYSQLINALDPGGLREVAGSNNNLVGSSAGTPGPFVPGSNTTVGQADQPFLRLSPTTYNPTGPDAPYATLGNGSAGNVSDATPRLVSNLVATSFTSGPYANPAAVEAVTDFYGSVPPVSENFAVLPNAGVLGGGRYNAWFVAFGQFFDHGLDFVQKGASGTITIELKPGDPLYVDPLDPGFVAGVSNIMRVSRANLANPASDFNPDGTLIAGTTPIYKNNTGLLIDQSQTYGSHESMNAFLREYDAAGHPTGRLVTGSGDANSDGVTDGLATWADLKANALKIGIVLTDQDIYDAPMLKVDATGRLLFTPDPADTWNTTTAFTGSDPNDPFYRDASGNVLHTNQAFLIDINSAADPNFLPDGPGYDAALLNAHYVTGDGRANENYLLTAVHHVFHEEHNFQLNNIKDSITRETAAILAAEGQAAAAAFIARWQTAPGVWDGEKLFQAARLITESEYNHIAIDQYIGTLYGALPEFVSYSSDIDMGVSLEFSQAIFRLGHSMLTETFKVADPNAPSGFTDVPLLQAFLNPTAFADLGPAAITAGLVRVYGNEVDEFVTPALQQSLLGQPLDLAAINISRGRDVGLPTHNELRQTIYDGLLKYTNNTNGGALAPYTSWQDYGDHLKHPGTLVNLIAAYARDLGDVWGIENARADYLAGTGTLDAIRASAQAVVDAYADVLNPDHAAAVEFMEGTPTYNPETGKYDFSGGDQGYWDVDLWIGGLAERPLFDGPLGTTFSYILLDFAQRQQDGDRFYYLYRTPIGMHLGNEIIANQFGELVTRATGLDHLNGDVFITPDAVFDLNPATNTDDFFDAATHTITYADLSIGPATGGHIIIAGNGGNDYLKAGLGDDTIYGDDGNDFIEGSQGNDHLYGGDGDDTIHDDENDDFIDGGAGNDRLFAGPGALDTVFGGFGDDELHGGDGIDELIGNEGDDLIFGDGDTDVLFGEDGNDYLEGGDSVDEMWGVDGNDWLRGGVGDDHLNGGAGNDLLEGGLGPSANDGDRLTGAGVVDSPFPFGPKPADVGVDIVSYEDVGTAITADLETSNTNGTGGLLDTYAEIEGSVGSRFNDNLTGAGPDTTTNNGINNILVGGAGDDTLTGLGGDDFIAGDSITVKNDLSVYLGPPIYTTITNWKGLGEDRPDFGVNGGLGHFLGDNGAPGTDKAVFSGRRSDYTITPNPDGTLRIVDNRAIDSTALGDTVMDVELLQFSDQVVALTNSMATGVPVISDMTPTEGPPPLTADTSGIADLNGLGPFSYQWQSLNGAVWTDIAGATAATFTPTDLAGQAFGPQAGLPLRVVVSFTDGLGNAESVTSAATDPVGVRWQGNNAANTFTGTDGSDNAAGAGGADIMNGGAGNDSLIGGADSDIMAGGDGADTINTGTSNGAVTDIVRFSAVTEFGDTVFNFDVNAGFDRVEFGGALNALLDDGTNDDNFTFVTGNGVNGGNTAADLNGTVEALLLGGTNGEGVGTGALNNATAVAGEFNTEFGITAVAGEAALLVINDTNANSFSVWQYVESGTGLEIQAAELSRIGNFSANGNVTTASFDLY